MTQQTRQPRQAPSHQAEQPAPSLEPAGPDNSSLADTLGFGGLDIPDIGASDWTEAVRKMGPLGTVVLDAQPDEMLLQGLPCLLGQRFVRDWVIEKAELGDLSDPLILQMIMSSVPVGGALGIRGQLEAEAGKFGVNPELEGELQRPTTEDWVVEASGTLAVSAGVGVATSLKGAFGETLAAASVGGGPAIEVHLLNRLDLGLTAGELGRVLLPALLGGGDWQGALGELCVAALEGHTPDEGSASLISGAEAQLVVPDVEANLPDWLSPESLPGLSDGLFMSGLASLGGAAGAALEWDGCGLQAVLRLGLGGTVDTDLGLLSLVPGLSELLDCGGEHERVIRLDVHEEGISFNRLEVIGADGTTLFFDALDRARDFFRGAVGPCATVGDALRESGLMGLTHTVSLPMSEEGVQFPGALEVLEDLLPDQHLIAGREETQVELTARVDAERLAAALEDCLGPSTMDPATWAMQALRATLDMTRGVRPPDWMTSRVDAARDCVGFDAPRLTGRIRFGVGAGGSLVAGLSGDAEATMRVDQELPRADARKVWPLVDA